MHTWHQDGLIRAYRLTYSTPAQADFPVPAGRLDGYAVAPGLDRAVYALPTRVTCVDRAGAALWQLDLGPAASPDAASVCVGYSRDGAILWIYCPDVVVRSSADDRLLAVDAASGRILAAAPLDAGGTGGDLIAVIDGCVLLDVSEGRNGSSIYRARLAGGRVEVQLYPWTDRLLLSLSQDGRHFMTVDQAQQDATFHRYPDGAIIARVAAQPGTTIPWAGGYLDPTTAVVTIASATDDDVFAQYLVTPTTGEVRDTLETGSHDPYDFVPLDDGSWITAGDSPEFQRHTR